jgi:hypothetical protein
MPRMGIRGKYTRGSRLMTSHEELVAHEKIYAEKYSCIYYRLDRLETMVCRLLWGCMTGFGTIVIAVVIGKL